MEKGLEMKSGTVVRVKDGVEIAGIKFGGAYGVVVGVQFKPLNTEMVMFEGTDFCEVDNVFLLDLAEIEEANKRTNEAETV
jgi:hypothetical protein